MGLIDLMHHTTATNQSMSVERDALKHQSIFFIPFKFG